MVLVCSMSQAIAAQDQDLEVIRAAKRAKAVRIGEPIRVDGVLNEASWERAEPIGDFYQQYPDEFKPARRRTEVRFLYDETTLYVGAMLYDDSPELLITNELRRDFSGADSDSFGLVLRTFHDLTNSYGFLTNPGGATRDTLATDNGRRNDANWDGVWFTRAAVVENGWSLEFAIPFKTLRFSDEEKQVWGLNIMRTSRHINERSTWTPVPRQFSHYNVDYAGILEGIEGAQPGRNLYVKPFATGQLGESMAVGPESGNEADGGVDLKWGVTSSLLMDASWRTDFSQVEADEQQINLTRFSTFFPEKRQFFLENPGNFQIGLQDARRDLVPYFTRRIGLVGGVPVPVVGGLRLTGQTGGLGVGLLNMQTEDAGVVPGSNYSAFVLRRPLSRTTSAGAFYFGRESAGTDAFNRVAGFDFRLSPVRTLELEAFAMRSATAGQSDDWAGRTGLLLDGSSHNARLGLLHVGRGFPPRSRLRSPRRNRHALRQLLEHQEARRTRPDACASTRSVQISR